MFLEGGHGKREKGARNTFTRSAEYYALELVEVLQYRKRRHHFRDLVAAYPLRQCRTARSGRVGLTMSVPDIP
eukprot:1148391-Rhodomonas_salina.1